MQEGDYMATLMYYAWVKHGIKPSEIYNMGSDELKILGAFYIIEMESRHIPR